VPLSLVSHYLFPKASREVERHTLVLKGDTCKGEGNVTSVCFRRFGTNLQEVVRTCHSVKFSLSLKCGANLITNEVEILFQFFIVFGVSFLIQYSGPHIIVRTGETNVDGLFQLLTNFRVGEGNTILNNFTQTVFNLSDSDRLTNGKSLNLTISEVGQITGVRYTQSNLQQLTTGSLILFRFSKPTKVSGLEFSSNLKGGEFHAFV